MARRSEPFAHTPVGPPTSAGPRRQAPATPRGCPERLADGCWEAKSQTHKHPAVKAWFAARPRYHIHFIPTSSSWLNAVERFFSEITAKRIRRGTFHSVRELQRAISAFVVDHNSHAKPFIWTKSARAILRKIKNCHAIYGSAHYVARCGQRASSNSSVQLPGFAGCGPDPTTPPHCAAPR